MTSLREWVARFTSQPIEAVVFGYHSTDDPPDAPTPGRVYSPEDAAPWLGMRFDCGYGSPETYAVAVYTATWVVSVSQYDGATKPFTLPRCPTAGFVPIMPGGG